MADQIPIGDLLVRISADITKLTEANKQVAQDMSKMKQNAASAGAGITSSFTLASAAVVAGAYMIFNAMTKAIDRIAEIGKTSEQLGIPVKDLGKLAYAAKQVGVDIDEVSMGIKRFSRSAAEIQPVTEPMNEFNRIMSALKVNVRDASGAIRPTIDVIADMSDRFSRMTQPMEKVRLAMELFGRSGADMLPMLNMGGAAMRSFFEKAEKGGLIMDETATKAAREYNVQISKITGTFDLLVKRITVEVLPTITTLAKNMAEGVRNTENMNIAMESLRVVFKGIVIVGETVVGILRAMLSGIGTIVATLFQLATGNFKKAGEILEKGILEVANTIGTTIQSVANHFVTTSQAVVVATGIMAGAMAPSAAAIEGAFKPVVQTAQQAATEFAAFKVAATGAMNDVVALPYATAKDKIEAIVTAAKKGAIGWREMGVMVRNVERENQQHMMDTASMAATTLTTVFGKSKAAAIAAALINTSVGITKAFATVPWPMDWIQAGLIAAQGVAQIAQIRSASADGSGGSPNVAGGGTAGAPPETTSAGGGGGSDRVMNITGMAPNALFTGESMRMIARNMIDWQRDGGRITLT